MLTELGGRDDRPAVRMDEKGPTAHTKKSDRTNQIGLLAVQYGSMRREAKRSIRADQIFSSDPCAPLAVRRCTLLPQGTIPPHHNVLLLTSTSIESLP
jgi:hypothetical protein